MKLKATYQNKGYLNQENYLNEIFPNMLHQIKWKLTMTQEIWDSNWLLALPIRTRSFSLNTHMAIWLDGQMTPGSLCIWGNL